MGYHHDVKMSPISPATNGDVVKVGIPDQESTKTA